MKRINKIIAIIIALTFLAACVSSPFRASIEAPPKPSTKEIQTLESSVKWQVKSKEYQLITRKIYKDASQVIMNKATPKVPWVVIMDVDETVLDNSQYQVDLNMNGLNYSKTSWDNWVKDRKANLVPGAKQFIETVISKGGKLVLITNRDKALDSFTWENLQTLDLPVNENNTCLIGRTKADIDAVNDVNYINDKDLRREQVTNGSASCYSSADKASLTWKNKQAVLMQVGDNIEDINNITQENADIDSILPRWGLDIIILPNPMYGSWN
ncbi:HAD family acid phosphatase [Glaciecola sp. MF2-115]|uniref:HAD family acid phosphatase n=1 Tax=Glaciecola sp. MF2-115 TaxID=3384827 RepID=UPI0039A26F70